MSRIGKLPIKIPDSVKIEFYNNFVTVEGKKGKLKEKIQSSIKIKIDDNNVIIERNSDDKKTRSFHGLYRSLIYNMIKGVSDGFSRDLVVNGIGYRVEMQGKNLLFSLGYSTQFEYVVPDDVVVQLDGNTKIRIEGIDKSRVGQVAAEIINFRGPDPYKGKGISYKEKVIKLKAGKSGVKK